MCFEGGKNSHMTAHQLIRHFKTGAEAARKLGMTRAAIALWKENGIPFSRQLQIEMLTGGELKAKKVRRSLVGK